MTTPLDATTAIADSNGRKAAELPFSDERDFAATTRGFIGALDSPVITDANGKPVWNCEEFDFLDGECPPTANPSLWRQGALVAKHGLYEITDRIYQIRGFDLSNMTIVEGDTGVIIIDPLISQETAAAGLALYRKHRGDKPVKSVIYSHCHIDHFGGVKGVTTNAAVDAGECSIIAPAGMVEHAVSENVYAGTAMARRAAYMYGAVLPRGAQGAIGAGLGQSTSTGLATLIFPTIDITETGHIETVDGVEIEFQMTPGTEAPAEMNFYFPQMRALCMAENATHNLHNLLTLRGAVVRDPHIWSKYLTEAINKFASRTDVVFASHHWPTWGTEELTEFLSVQRDLYGYLHDQTLRALNQGKTGLEIAEDIVLPPALENVWHTHGYYGSVSHNVKAIYQRYMGWFDGVPAHLWEHPPVEAAKRHVEFMGGADAVIEKARKSYDEGDFRWVAQVVNYVVFADANNTAAKELLANAYEQLGYGSENGTWRNFYLMGAYELRNGAIGTPLSSASEDIMGAMTVEQIFDAIALRVNGPASWDAHITLDWTITDENQNHRTELRNGLLVHFDVPDGAGAADATFTLTKPALFGLLLGGVDPQQAVSDGSLTVDGDIAKFAELAAHLDAPDPDFAIVTP